MNSCKKCKRAVLLWKDTGLCSWCYSHPNGPLPPNAEVITTLEEENLNLKKELNRIQSLVFYFVAKLRRQADILNPAMDSLFDYADTLIMHDGPAENKNAQRR